MQQVVGVFCGEYRVLELPDPRESLMSGVRWGSHEHAFTPAFWVSQAWQVGHPTEAEFCLGDTLEEEVAICLLGGHGVPAEVGLAAFNRIRVELRARNNILPVHIAEALLMEPLMVGERRVRYRFARQRARYLAGSLEGLRKIDAASLDDLRLRDALCGLPGIGPKTASWIVRNRRASDHVAILDIHIMRACRLMGIFPENLNPAQHYRKLERLFIQFCIHAGVRASVLDAVMWATMRKLSPRTMRLFVDEMHSAAQTSRATFERGGENDRERGIEERLGIQ